MLHDPETAGHPGEIATYNAVRQHYWWPGLRTFVKNYVQVCGVCQQFKIDRTPPKPALLRLQTIKAIVNSHRFEGSSSDEPRRVQVLDLYCLTRFESEGSGRGDVY